jgi:hypothetical protein
MIQSSQVNLPPSPPAMLDLLPVLGRPTLTTRPSLRVLQPLQRPIIAEIDLFDMDDFMERIELEVRSIDGYRSVSKFKLWEPLFDDIAALREPLLCAQLTALIQVNSSLYLHWRKLNVPAYSDPIIFTALPLALCKKLLDEAESGPEFLFTSRWSLHALPTLARQSILDDFLD